MGASVLTNRCLIVWAGVGSRLGRVIIIPGERADSMHDASHDLLAFAGERRFPTILADPPWQFTNKTGKVAPEHKRLSRYGTMKLDEIMALPVGQLAAPTAH